MIKCNAKISGTISRNAVRRRSELQGEYLLFYVDVQLPSFPIEAKEVKEITVLYKTKHPSSDFKAGKRIDCYGALSFSKRGEIVNMLMIAQSADIVMPNATDSIEGQMAFLGAVGKNIDVRKDRHNNPMLIFSAYSAEKTDDGYEHLWVRFVSFGMEKEVWLQPKSKIEATGKLELSSIQGVLRISCILSKFSLYGKKVPIVKQTKN